MRLEVASVEDDLAHNSSHKGVAVHIQKVCISQSNGLTHPSEINAGIARARLCTHGQDSDATLGTLREFRLYSAPLQQSQQ